MVGIADIDTRRLTRILREKGAQNGCIMAGDGSTKRQALAAARGFPGLQGHGSGQGGDHRAAYAWGEGTWALGEGHLQAAIAEHARFHVVAYDFGVKRNILRMLVDRGCRVTVVPAQTPAAEVLALAPDGVFLSNGPGDPEPCDYAIEAIRRDRSTAALPIFGICLGHQLLALASGARTVKMKFGHHGANHPVQDLADGRGDDHQPEPRLCGGRSDACRPTCARRTDRCSTARCRVFTAPTGRRSVSRVTRRPAPVRTTWHRCSIISSS